ncbi:MAG: GspH/FimT family pseudopilin [Endozoicomonas sp. (ex Botrylloides leachii)]|nr:GspH/FimT family pseudopilin [Endozoicomonas sp. (ex Botrylloides leachii)]
MRFYDENGFSLIELMATLSIAAILAALAIPNMRSVLAGHRVAVVTKQLYGSIMLARSEAVKRADFVSLCRSTHVGLCAGDGNNWASGWLVFADKNGNGMLDGDEEKIKVYQLSSESMTIDWNRGPFLRMNSRGQAVDSGTFTLCESTSEDHVSVRVITVSLTGRARIAMPQMCQS